MIEIQQNIDITHLTTFGIKVKARYFAEYESERELLAISRRPEFLENEVLHIGGGSNLLFLSDYNGLVLHSKIKGIKEYRKNDSTVFAIVGAGVKWCDFVEWTLEHNLSGVENLAHIPGEVGASAIQNVGAYGVEAKDVIFSVECFDTVSRKVVTIYNKDCEFGYRDSRFKRDWKGRYYVLRVSFLLNPDGKPGSLEYGPLKNLEKKLGHAPSVREVAREVTEIRKSKLPEPSETGSAGSFFKNPSVTKKFYSILQLDYPDIPGYELENGRIKLSAAWLIDHAGLKGLRIGGAETYHKQPLVIINNGNASAEDVKRLSDEIVMKVRSKFYTTLKPEVNFIDTRINVTILGSGTSKGVPEIGCECDTCISQDSRDKRLRASALVETAGMRILIDPSPDFRQQALTHRIIDLDAVLVTHSHYDHVGGFDDLRPFCAPDRLNVYLRKDVNADLHKRLDYCFRDHLYPGVPTFHMQEIGDEPFFIRGLKVTPVEVMHGKLPIVGFRIGKFAYITDAKTISEEERDKLRGLDVLVINALRDLDHFAHMTIEEALAMIRDLNPRRAFLTHMNHEAGRYEDLARRLPDNVRPCYDGLKISIDN